MPDPVVLPSVPGPAKADFFQISFSEDQTPFLGGPETNLFRPGSRMGIKIELPPMLPHVARPWITRLLVSESDNVIYDWPQPSFVNSITATITTTTTGVEPNTVTTTTQNKIEVSANTVANSFDVPFRNMAGGVWQEGQWISIIHLGRRYLHFIRSATATTLAIYPPTRVPLTAGDEIEVAPKIQGRIKGDARGWTVDAAHIHGLGFEIREVE